MEPVGDRVCISKSKNMSVMRKSFIGALEHKKILYRIITIAVVFGIWQLGANHYHSAFLLPSPWKTLVTFTSVVHDPDIIKNLLITLKRVLTGFFIALVLGVPIGFLIGYSKTAMQLLNPLIDSIRQVPIMAWVPLTIVWFGLGNGPTIFIITLTGIFPIIINTMAGVQGISSDYYNAARSMGAKPWSIFAHIIVPASIPDILLGGRLAVGQGWMTVI